MFNKLGDKELQNLSFISIGVSLGLLVASLSFGASVAHADTSYRRMNFGFNKCPVRWGPLYRGISQAEIEDLASRANANGYEL